jgi:GNAT superfamily N-acetyltransferase
MLKGTTEIGMAMQLDELPNASVGPDGLTIRRVESVEEMASWRGIVQEANGYPDDLGRALTAAASAGGFEADAAVRNYLGWLNGGAVAAGTVLLARGVAGLYNAATLPHARGMGVYAAMVHARLRDAARAGFGVAVTIDNPHTASIDAALGYLECCRLTTFVWRPDPAWQLKRRLIGLLRRRDKSTGVGVAHKTNV